MMYDWQVSFAENKALSVAIGGSGTELGENPAAPAPVLRALFLSHILAQLAPAPDSFGSLNGRKPLEQSHGESRRLALQFHAAASPLAGYLYTWTVTMPERNLPQPGTL